MPNSEDNISDLDDDEISQITKEADKKEVSEGFKDKVITYVKIDDLIRQKTEEIKELKEKKKPCEEYIIRYLEKQGGDHVNLVDGKLVKNEVETRGPLKSDIIKDAIKEEIIKQKITTDVVKCENLVNDILELADSKRPITKKVNIKRTFIKNKDKK